MKKCLSLFISLLIFTCLFSGCAGGETSAETPEKTSLPISPSAQPVTEERELPVLEHNEFSSALIEFLEKSGYENTNFLLSPASFRAALLLAACGAETETQNQLLSAMGFSGIEEADAWYAGLLSSADLFEKELAVQKEDYEKYREYYEEDAKEPDGAFQLANSVWRNTKAAGSLKQSYLGYVREHYGAEAENVSAEEITERVNDWVRKNTGGLIPMISEDLSLADLILVNTLYLKSSWICPFSDYATEEADFTAFDGSVVKKDFMRLQDQFRYYEEKNGKLIILPLHGGVNAVFVLGEMEDVLDRIPEAQFEEVLVSLPKFETESSFDHRELLDFLKARGCELPFREEADFSSMSDDRVYITDIIQKTKILTDEKGIEAAAATAVMMELQAAMVEEEIREFKADQPFRYMIVTDSKTPELLFYGQIVE